MYELKEEKKETQIGSKIKGGCIPTSRERH